MNAVQYSFEPLLRVAQAFAATPRVMAELDQLLRNPNTDIGDITALLKRDGTLSARLLRIANSAAFGQASHVASIDDAAALIGFREIHRLVGAVAVDQFSQRNYPLYGFVGQRARENGLYVALLMEELAKPAKQDPQIAYTVGLFRAIGNLPSKNSPKKKVLQLRSSRTPARTSCSGKNSHSEFPLTKQPRPSCGSGAFLLKFLRPSSPTIYRAKTTSHLRRC